MLAVVTDQGGKGRQVRGAAEAGAGGSRNPVRDAESRFETPASGMVRGF